MRKIKWWRFQQTVVNGWKVAGEIESGIKRIGVYWDILFSFHRFFTTPTQYQQNKVWTLPPSEKEVILKPLGERNKEKDEWVEKYYENWQFLNEYTSFKWQKTPLLVAKRNAAYTKRYGFGSGVAIQYGVTFIKEHESREEMKVGRNVLFAREVDVDYTGGLKIGDNVAISEGAKILTHSHVIDSSSKGKYGRIDTPLIIHDRVWIGARAIIMSGVREIGRGAMISADSLVNVKIPPYAIVMGNPGKIIGFRYTPKEIVEMEMSRYPKEDRIPEELLQKNYEKYFLKRWKDIKEFIKL